MKNPDWPDEWVLPDELVKRLLSVSPSGYPNDDYPVDEMRDLD